MAGLGIVLYHGIESGTDLKRYGQIAEDAGFESLWVTERYFHEETFSLLGFLAAATSDIKLGLGVTNPYTRSPALLAMAAATLDRISGGRFLLGLGRSEASLIERRMGVPYGDPRSTLREVTGVLRQLMSGEQVTLAKGRFRMQDVQLAIEPAQERVPIYLAAIGPRALSLAGAIADGVLLSAYAPVQYIRYAVHEVRDAARKEGRDPDSVGIACMLVVRLTDDRDSIWPGLKRRIVRLLAEPHVGEILLEKGGFDTSILEELRASTDEDGARLITDDMVDSFYLVGSEAQCRERIAQYRDAGVDRPLLLPQLDDYERVATSLGD